ncbi:MAG: glycosyltransferase family 4 protein [Clostridia bacterium]|nr:glycosyltransferase family 4 protein [Clostridia bacterium]
MNILFLALGNYASINRRGIYLDLLRVFIKNGHEVYIVTSLEADSPDPFKLIKEPGSHLLKVKTGRITKTNIIEKGINTLLIEKRYIKAIEQHFSGVKFDLVLYPTPPITFLNVVQYIKGRDHAQAYLMLKDIFPQNAVDIGMMKKSGVKGVAYRYFRKKEKRLYAVSDHIGCMSQANVDYLLKHDPEIDPQKIEICPNSTEIEDKSVSGAVRDQIREKYGIPADKKVYIYGGNLGKPQGIPFLIKCLKEARDIEDAFFLIVGAGTEFGKIETYLNTSGQENARLMKRLPKEDYDAMVGACDVGMIFLDHRFTIPNFPSRLLSCMQAKLPVLAVTDPNTDVGKTVVDGGFGWWVESNDAQAFADTVRAINARDDFSEMKEREFAFLKEHYSVETTYAVIRDALGWEDGKTAEKTDREAVTVQ